MKVMIVAPYFYPHVGGAEVYTINIARQLRSLGWKVVIVTTDSSRHKTPETLEGMTVYRLRTALTLSNTPTGIGWRRELKKIFKIEQPDVINAHTPVPYLADMAQRSRGKIPFVLTYHNDLAKDSLLAKAAVWIAQFTLIRGTLRKCTRIIATSEYYVQESRYLKRHSSKVDIVSPGVDISRFNPDVQVGAELIARYRGQRVILFVGSVNKSHQHKGLNVLIKAFKLVRRQSPDTRLVIVGGGDGIDMYRSLACADGVAESIDFTGYVDDETLVQYYRLATVFAMPSTNDSEGFGMAYIEANAVGTPVVGTRVGGVPFAIEENKTGLLVEPHSVDSLYHALQTILDDSELANRLGTAGSVRVLREFDWRMLAERTSQIFARVSRQSGETAQRTKIGSR